MTQNANISIFGVLQFCSKKRICLFCIFAFCVITIVPIMIQTHKVPQNDHLDFSFVKEGDTAGKKMARYGSKMTIYQLLFFES
jgi:hypothetical protein